MKGPTFLNARSRRVPVASPSRSGVTEARKPHFTRALSLLDGCRAHFFSCPWPKRKRNVCCRPENKSIALRRLVHLFPTLHNIPPGAKNASPSNHSTTRPSLFLPSFQCRDRSFRASLSKRFREICLRKCFCVPPTALANRLHVTR